MKTRYIPFFCCFFVCGYTWSRLAVVIVPVADYFSHHPTVAERGAGLLSPAFSGETGGCIRSCQGLFNDLVDVVEDLRDELVKILVPNTFYAFESDSKPTNDFWTSSKNLQFLDEIAPKIDASIFPPPVSFENPASVIDPSVVTLKLPWFEPRTKRLFSAGTRFVKSTNRRRSAQSCPITLFDPTKNTSYQLRIPHTVCMPAVHTLSLSQRRRLFIQLLREWMHFDTGIIPYVLGGTSFTKTIADGPFKQKSVLIDGKPATFWVRPGHPKTDVLTGVDCSGLILRAAQMCGIPYFFKTSHTLAQKAVPLAPGMMPQIGDILWHPGHVMIVSSLKPARLIEAAGYDTSKFGKMQEIDLPHRLQDIKTYKQLVTAIKNNQKVTRLNKMGQPEKTAFMRIYPQVG